MVRKTKASESERIPVHRLQLTLPPGPHPRWRDLDPDVQTLLCAFVDACPKVPHTIHCWENGLDGKPHPSAFLRTCERSTGLSEARAEQALREAARLRLIVRPNPTGGKQRCVATMRKNREVGSTVEGDYAYITALGYKLTRREADTAPIRERLAMRATMAFRAWVWVVWEFLKQFATPRCTFHFSTPEVRREVELRLTLLACWAERVWPKLTEADREAIEVIFVATLGPGTRGAWLHLWSESKGLSELPLLLRAHELGRMPGIATHLRMAFVQLSRDALNGQLRQDAAGMDYLMKWATKRCADLDKPYRAVDPPDKDVTIEDAYHRLATAVDTAMTAVQQRQARAEERVILSAPGDAVLVRGKTKSRLSRARYDVVRACVEAGEDGITKDQLERRSEHGDAVNILKRLERSDPDWKKVIQLAGRPGGRYRIRGEITTHPHK